MIHVRFTPDTVAKLFSDHWDAILIRAVVPLGKNDSWPRRFRFYRCAEVVIVRVLQQYPPESGHSEGGRGMSVNDPKRTFNHPVQVTLDGT